MLEDNDDDASDYKDDDLGQYYQEIIDAHGILVKELNNSCTVASRTIFNFLHGKPGVKNSSKSEIIRTIYRLIDKNEGEQKPEKDLSDHFEKTMARMCRVLDPEMKEIAIRQLEVLANHQSFKVNRIVKRIETE